MIYLKYSQSELDLQYDQRTLVPDLAAYVEYWTNASIEARENLACRLDLAYGPAEVETLDVFPASGDKAPIHVHIHGGAWRSLGKEHASFPAPHFVANGVTFISLNFGRTPEYTIGKIVDQVRRAIKWIWENASSLNGDRNQIYISGHSSGAHLAASVLADGWRASLELPENIIRAAVLASGPYDLEPVRLSSRNEFLNLDRISADQNNPLIHIPPSGPPVFICWGDGELAEFQRQGTAFGAAWKTAGNVCQSLVIENQNHFDISNLFGQADSVIIKTALAQISQSD